MRKKIKSWWTYERGRWDNKTSRYVNRTISEPVEKILEMELVAREGGPVIQFYGGPTGHEGYYVDDLLFGPERLAAEKFCICAGTINSCWPKCWVFWGDVKEFLEENGYEN